MTTQLEQTARQALEALADPLSPTKRVNAITALRAALTEAALERKAENERELGIQMQPAQDCQHCGGTGDVSGEYPGVACPECTGTGVKTQPEFIKHEEGEDGWSEWVCPDPKSYLMKCCDCGLVHEAEFKVVRYKSETEREVCEPVDDPNLQAVFRMRRSEQWSPVDTAHRAGGLPMEQPAQDEPVEYWTVADGWVSEQAEVPAAVWVEPDFWEHCNRFNCGTAYRLPAPGRKPLYIRPQPVPTSDTSQNRVDEIAKQRHEWVGLTDEEFEKLIDEAGFTRTDLLMIGACVDQIARAIEAKLKEKNT